MKQILINIKELVGIDEYSVDLYSEKEDDFTFIDTPSKLKGEIESFISKNNSEKEHLDYYKTRNFYKIFWSYESNKYMWKYIVSVNGDENEEHQELNKDEYKKLKDICTKFSLQKKNKIDLFLNQLYNNN